MIMIDVIIQGTISAASGETGFLTPTPFPIYLEDNWESSLTLGTAYHDNSSTLRTLSHRSIDNGVTYSVISDTAATTYNNGQHTPLPTIGGNGILARKQGGWVQFKTATGDWQERQMSNLPGSTIGGGSFVSLTHDYTNNQFILITGGSALGFGTVDIATTPDFIVISNTADGEVNPLTVTANNLMSDVHNIWFIGGQYVAYGIESGSTTKHITATSPDLFNWTKQTTSLPVSRHTTQVFFSNRYIISRNNNNGGGAARDIEIWSSTDGLVWTQATLPAKEVTVGVVDYDWLVTATAVELLTAAYVYRSTDGIIWTRALVKNNLKAELRFNVIPCENNCHFNGKLIGHAKGSLMDSAAGPDHIAVVNAYAIELGGKTVKLSQMNAVPTLGYPSTAPHGATVGWLQESRKGQSTIMVIDDGFTLSGSPASGTAFGQSLYARNTTTTRYFEITVISAGGIANRIGAKGMGYEDTSGTDAVFFTLDNNVVSVSNGVNITVTHTHTTGQIVGFLFDFTAKTCVISVNGTTLATVPNVNTLLSWIVDAFILDGKFKLNVGQESFSHNGTGATAWQTQ